MRSKQYLVVARHAESQANRDLMQTDCGLYYSRSGSDPEVDLTNKGRRQANRLGERLKLFFNRRFPLSVVYGTRYHRVQRTLDLALKEIPYQVPVITDPRLEKRAYGAFWNLTHQGVQTLYPDEHARYNELGEFLYRAPGGGENYPDLFARIDDFVDNELENLKGNALIVTHSVVALAIRRKLEGLSDAELLRMYNDSAVRNTEIRVYMREPGGSWRVCNTRNRLPFCRRMRAA